MNVLDHLKNLEVDAVKNYCASNCIDAAVAMTHISGDFNLSNVLRSANFFGFKEAYYIGGSKQYDRRGTVGTHHYTPMHYCKDESIFFNEIKDKYVPIALENNVNYPMQNLFSYQWPSNPIIIVGEEMLGLSDNILTLCKDIITIPAFGSVRSMNVGTAAGIAMAFYRNYLTRNTVGV